MSIDWHQLPDADAVAQEAAHLIQSAAQKAIATRDQFSLVLAGGGTPLAAYRLLSHTQQDWARWQIWFGDERCLAPEHPERNSLMAFRAWLDHVDIPAENFHPIPAERGPEAGAADYSTQIAPVLPFDLVLLGIGEDGHTASLFPGDCHPDHPLAQPVRNASKPPPERVSLSPLALASCREMLVMVSGSSKRLALQGWKTGQVLPISEITARAPKVLVLHDDAAAQAAP